MIRYVSLPVTWTSLSLSEWGSRAEEGAILRRMERILWQWEGTPYVPGQCLRGVGAFCTAFLCAVLDELYGRTPATPLPEIPDDASMHSPETARAGLRWFLRHYPNHVQIFDGIVQPGDVLVTGPKGGGPGHAILVGPRENTMWQCSGRSVHFTGLSIPDTYTLHAIYRMTDRLAWSSESHTSS